MPELLSLLARVPVPPLLASMAGFLAIGVVMITVSWTAVFGFTLP